MFDHCRTIDKLEALAILWSDCVMLREENAPNCGGQVSGFCIVTVLPPTQH
jgi:hypothetical protein